MKETSLTRLDNLVNQFTHMYMYLGTYSYPIPKIYLTKSTIKGILVKGVKLPTNHVLALPNGSYDDHYRISYLSLISSIT
jgi:hypothetical protein